MNVKTQIKEFIASLEEPKRAEIVRLHELIQAQQPKCQLWFETGIDSSGKAVTNPNIGYGHQTMRYANGSTREFYRVGVSATKSGISIYILGLADRNALKKLFAARLGKVSVTGYCIKFKKLTDVDLEVLAEAVKYGLEQEG